MHNTPCKVPGGKAGKNKTEPTLPDRTIVDEDGVSVQHYYRSNDHAPAHAHVKGGGKEVRIGPNGKPIAGDPELSTAQKTVIQNNKSTIRGAVNKIGKWLKHHEDKGK